VLEPSQGGVAATERDHTQRSLGVGLRWAVAGWSRYAARRSFVARAATRPAEPSAGRVGGSGEERAWARRIETTLGCRWGSACAGLLPGGLDTQGPRKLVPATRPAEPTAGRVPPRALARGGGSRPLGAVAGGRSALSCCRVVSIRRDLASSSLLLDQRNPPLVECLHERQRGEVYRDHSGLSLGVGPRWAVAGWSRYAFKALVPPPQAGGAPQRVAAARPAERVTGRTTRPAVLPTLQRVQRRDNVVATKL
jgi:hypothetical protein